MPIDPSIPMSNQLYDWSLPFRERRENRRQNELMEMTRAQEQRAIDREKREAEQYQTEAYYQRERNRATSVIQAAVELQPILESGDAQAVKNYLTRRRDSLLEAQRGGANVDTRETDEAISVFQRGGIPALQGLTGQVIEAARAAGALPTPEAKETFATVVDEQGNPVSQRSSTTGREYDHPRAPRQPGVEVNVGTGEGAATEAFGRSVGEAAAERRAQAAQAQSQIANLERMQVALERGAQTGRGQETLLNLKSLGATLFPNITINDEDAEQEVLRKIGSELALQLRNPDSGLGLPGATSNRDLDFLKSAVPGLQNTASGNRSMIDYAIRVNRMKVATFAEQARIIQQNGGVVPNDLDARLLDFVNNYQLFTPQERSLIEAAQSAASATASGISEDTRVINFNDLPE